MGQNSQSEWPVEAKVYEHLDKVRFLFSFFSSLLDHCIVLKKYVG